MQVCQGMVVSAVAVAHQECRLEVQVPEVSVLQTENLGTLQLNLKVVLVGQIQVAVAVAVLMRMVQVVQVVPA
jgi:hypothetical protein